MPSRNDLPTIWLISLSLIYFGLNIYVDLVIKWISIKINNFSKSFEDIIDIFVLDIDFIIVPVHIETWEGLFSLFDFQEGGVNFFDFNLSHILFREISGIIRVNLNTKSKNRNWKEPIEFKFSQELIFAFGEIINSNPWYNWGIDNSNPKQFATQCAFILCQFRWNVR